MSRLEKFIGISDRSLFGPVEARVKADQARFAVRISFRFLFHFLNNTREIFGGDLGKTLVFFAIAQANIGYIDRARDEGLRYGGLDAAPPDSLRRPIATSKVALSLGLPRESVRRRVRRLVEDGLLEEVEGGVVAPTRVFEDQRFRKVFLANSGAFLGLYAALVRAHFDGTPAVMPPINPDTLPRRAIGRLVVGFILRFLEEIQTYFEGDLQVGLVFIGLKLANTGYLIDLPDPIFASIEDVTPDEARRPITALALATEIGLPRETVRRHLRKLEQMGLCRAEKGGLVAPQLSGRDPAILGLIQRNDANMRLLLRQLKGVGFPPES